MIIRKYIHLFSLLFIVACTDQEFDPTQTNTVIVEGYLYANQPVNAIRISQLIPFITTENESFEIGDAEVSILWDNQTFLLTPSKDSIGLYQFDGFDLNILEDNLYEISLQYFGRSISAQTIVPSSTKSLAISQSSIEMAPIESFDDLFNRGEVENIEIYWDNDLGESYYVLIENMEEDPEEINTLDFNGQRPGNFNMVTQPTTLDVYNIRPFSLTQYGQYRVVVYHVAQEYVDLYETAEQDSRNLTEPINNINNGLGIFTSFNSDTVYFEVTKP